MSWSKIVSHQNHSIACTTNIYTQQSSKMKQICFAHLIPPSLLILLTSLLTTTSSQFIYPPNVPPDKSLSDYTSGFASPITNYIIHDAIIGSYTTPKPAFSITRCAHSGRTDPIYPSNNTFNSTQGHIAPDGTWQVMDGYHNSPSNIFSAGENLWIIPDFAEYVGNETTGNMCWWELYSVVEEQIAPYNCDSTERECPVGRLMQEVTLLGGDTENYFASTPFVVQTTMREGNRNYTWGSGGGYDNRASSTAIHAGNRPTGNVAPRKTHRGMDGSCGLFEVTSLLGILLAFAV